MDNIKRKLIALGLTLGIAASSFTACSSIEKHQELNQKRDFVASSMSDDANVDFYKIKSLFTSMTGDGFFVNFVGHNDTKFTPGWYGGSYENHKDYNICYKIDEDCYKKLNEHKKNFGSVYGMNEEGLDLIEFIIENYDVSSVEQVEEDELCKQ